ncbi:MAG: SCO family protein [Roseibium sp.]
MIIYLRAAIVAVVFSMSQVLSVTSSLADEHGMSHVPSLPLHQDFGGPFNLTDHNGMSFSHEQLVNQHTLVYFGYTSCPDICAIALNTIAVSLDAIGKETGNVQPVFVNLDHDRDDLSALREYVGFFHEDLLGLTGSPEQLRAISGAYGVRYKSAHNHDGEHVITHSGMIFLIGPDGEPQAMLPHDVSEDWLIATLKEHLRKTTGG